MTVVSVHPPSGGFVGIAALVTLGIYWLAHLYTEVLAERISEPGIPVWHRTIEAAGHETAILEGGLPVVACYAIVHGFGVNISDSALTALWSRSCSSPTSVTGSAARCGRPASA